MDTVAVDCCNIVKDCVEPEDCHWFMQFVLVQQDSADPATPGYAGLPLPAAIARDRSLAKSIITATKSVLGRINVTAGRPTGRVRVRSASRRIVAKDAFDVTPGLLAAADWYSALAAATPKAVWAIGIRFSHCWQSKGYHRGGLVKSIPLSPDESLQITITTWDKVTERSSLTDLLERNVSYELTREEKWSLAAKTVFANQTNVDVNPSAGLNGDVGVPVSQVTAKAGGKLGISGDLKDQVSNTTEGTTEFVQSQMIKSAESLKVARTSTVEVTHDTGQETSSIQTLSNPNHCHSVTYHYFDVVQEFEITTRPIEVAPYLLVPLPLPEVTPEWVLCHECYLRRVIDCTRYLAGFDAARTLLIADQLDQILAAQATQAVADNAGKLKISDRFGPDVMAALAAYDVMRDATVLGSPPAGGAGQGLQDAYDGLVKVASTAVSDVQKVGGAIVNVGESVIKAVFPH